MTGYMLQDTVRGCPVSNIPINTEIMENSKKPLPTLEQALKEGAERRERELQEDDDPKTDVDKLLDEQKRGQPIVPDYDEL